MGLLDGLLGGVMGGIFGGGQQQPANPLLAIALQMLQQNGGLQGLLAKAQQAGYGEQVQSWIGTGQNMPIDAGALSQIFGHGQLGQIAQQLGVSRDEATGQLAQTLPQMVDEMTPQGQIPADHDDFVSRTLAILQQQRGG
jgi:uncharacterized protein YidB (DUF937 family)